MNIAASKTRFTRWLTRALGSAAIALGASGPAAAQSTDPLVVDWLAAIGGAEFSECKGCHGMAVSATNGGSAINNTFNYGRILSVSLFSSPYTGETAAGNAIRAWCNAGGGGVGSTMCATYGTYLTGITNENARKVYRYIRAARSVVTSSSSLSFGSVRLGSTSGTTGTITLKNYRAQTVDFTVSLPSSDYSVSVSGATCTANGNGGTISGADATTGDPSSCTVSVQFHPVTAVSTTATNRNGTLTVNYTAGGTDPAPISPASSSFSLTGTALIPTIAISAWSGSFTAAVGSSVSRTATLTNSGNASLSLSSLQLQNNPQGDFAFSGANTCSTSASIAGSGGTCTLGVTFSPTVLAGTHSVRVAITHNAPAPGTTSDIDITGTPQQGTFGGVTGDTGAFGTVLQGATASQTYTVSNSGSATLSSLAFNVTGTHASEFTRTGGTCGSSLNAGSSCTVTYQFRPATASALAPGVTSAKAATLTISSSNASNASPTVALSGTAQGLANPAATTPAAFPSTQVGTTSGTTRSITLSNGRANAVTYTVATTGTNAADFSVTAESCAPSRSVAGGGSCTITYQFSPSLALSNNTRTAAASFSLAGSGTDPAPTNSPIAVNLSGDATTAPAFAINSTALNLSSVVNVAAAPVSITVTNNGTAALVLSSLVVGGTNPSDYALGGTCANGSSLAGTLAAPRSSCTISVTFTPGAVGTRNATLTVNHNDATVNGGASVVSLSGTGTPSLTPVLDLGGTAQLAFGSVLQGASSQLSFTVRNSNTNAGATALQLSGLAISGAASSDYTRSGTCTPTTTLAGGASCTVAITFAPVAAGVRAAQLDVTTSNATNAAVALGGTGVALADATLTGVPLPAFPSTLFATTSPTSGTVTVNNPRANTISYAAAFTGTNAADFQVGSESCATRVVPAGGSCTVQIRFTPVTGAAGVRAANLQFSFTGFGADPSPAALSTALSGTAELPAPVFSSSATAMSFSAVVLSPTTSSAVITNTGTANLALSALSFSGAQASDFRLAGTNACTAATTLVPSSSCMLVVQYDPAAAGTGTASLTIASNAAGSPHGISLSGTATPTPRPRIALSSQALSFGSFVLGTPSTQTVTVQNVGDATMNFSGFPITGAAAGDFSRGGSCAVATALAPSAQCDLTITFNPVAVGSRAASLAVNSDAANGTATVSLSGTGVPVPAPVVTLSAVSGLPLEFGTQTIGGLYPNRRVTLTNSGNADLAISALTVEGAGFANVSAAACPNTLTAGSSCPIDVSFTPTAAATEYNGNLRVVSTAAGSPHLAALHGRGTVATVPSVVWEPLVSRMDFGQVLAGEVSAVQSATLRNAGPGGLRLTLLNAVGPDAAAFSVTAGSCAIGEVLFEGQTCRVDIRFAPGSSGAKNANVQVASSGSFPSDLALAGVGMGGPNPGLALSLRSLTLGTVRVGAQSAPAELTLAANGSGVIRITTLTTTTGFTVQAKSCPALPFTLQAGSECTVTVVFTPQALGAATGQLVVTSDATNGTEQQVALNGSGEAPPDVSSGGCSISQGDSVLDPTLWLLVLMALAGLAYRRRLRRACQPRAHATRRSE